MKDFVCRMPDEIHDKIREISYNNNASMSEIIRTILIDYCDKKPDSIIKKIKENKANKKKRKSSSNFYKLTEPLLMKVWDNSEDDAYNDI
jgi:hypothetical protein